MKTTRRFIAMTAALTLTACVAMPAAMMTASAEDYTITFDQTNGTNTDKTYAGDSATHTYGAYQIFSGTLTTQTTGEAQNQVTSKILSDIGWGSGVDFTQTGKDLASLVTALNANNAFSNITISGKTDKQVAQDIAEALKNESNDSATAIFFAKTIAGYLSSTKVANSGSTITIPEADAGYYLIQDDAAADEGSKTRYILSVVDNVTIKAKNSAPTAIKKVKENNSSNYATDAATIGSTTVDAANTGYNDVADYSIGDAVPFKLYGTLPDASTYADYNAYYYKFTDTLGKEFDQPETVTVKAGSATLIFKKDTTDTSKYNLDTTNSTNTLAEGVTDATGDVIVAWTAPASGDAAGTLAITFENIKDYIATIPATAPVVTVEYDAVLNTNAVVGTPGQTNAVQLSYSSNPNVTWTPTKDDTPDTPPENEESPEDKVIVFTYELDINKVDESSNKLAGAKFIVKALDGAHAGEYVTVDTNNKVSGWLATAPTDTTKGKDEGVFTSTTTDLISIIGLDDGQYEISELAPPAGYNPLSASKLWTIEASTNNTQAWDNFVATDALTAIGLKENNSSINQNSSDTSHGIVEGKIENKSGSTLPSTGGIGTTLFILGGGCAAGIGGIYLISKKRTGKEE